MSGYIARLTIVIDIPIARQFAGGYLQGAGYGELSDAEIAALDDSVIREAIEHWWETEGDYVHAVTEDSHTIVAGVCRVREASEDESAKEDLPTMESVFESWVAGSQRCRSCRSAAINPGSHGRQPMVDLDLCDVCYWRKRAEDPGYVGRDWSEFALTSLSEKNR